MSDNNQIQKLEPKVTNLNPFGGAAVSAPAPASGGNALMTAEMQRSIAEVHASFMFAMHRPRNQSQAVDNMLIECQRKTLAEVAIYSFPRGGQEVTGPSIRLAEAIKRNWGHMKSGWRCLERRPGVSLLQAYAYDYQTGVSEMREFEVRHVRDTKKGQKPLTDERDIYEMEANQAARRVRACILALIPGDIIDACVEQCETTMKASADVTPDNIKKMLATFAKFNVDRKMIEKRLGRNVETISPAQMVGMQKIYNSLKDEMSTIEQWFDVSLREIPEEGKPAEPEKPEAKEKTLESFKEENAPAPEKKPEPAAVCKSCDGSGIIEFMDEEDGQMVRQPCSCKTQQGKLV